MKYVIFKKGDMIQPILFNDMLNHCDVKVGEGWEPVAAGFCIKSFETNGFKTNRIIVLGKESESLKIGPTQYDESLINAMVDNYTVAHVYMDFDGLYKIPNKTE